MPATTPFAPVRRRPTRRPERLRGHGRCSPRRMPPAARRGRRQRRLLRGICTRRATRPRPTTGFAQPAADSATGQSSTTRLQGLRRETPRADRRGRPPERGPPVRTRPPPPPPPQTPPPLLLQLPRGRRRPRSSPKASRGPGRGPPRSSPPAPRRRRGGRRATVRRIGESTFRRRMGSPRRGRSPPSWRRGTSPCRRVPAMGLPASP
mmetsp:Transcript_126521/g.366260  ORF Transcript_126521/g.366260 Transcript_126521/m.366260 type:complete len:207 (-) Transcript_126521:5-625(-)